MNYIERLLFLRNEVDTLDFRIRWCLESSFDFAQAEYRLLSWLHFAVTCYLKQLVIDVNLKRGSDFPLRSRLFCFKSLETLMMCFSHGTGIPKIPPSIGNSTSGFSSLKFLKMISVRVD
ncbi:hypothetical protein TIFTF001_021844 [Ficus carica]|uniref:Uncharacterized protein n=1 Tax=Ficus carica TaxID=3494 RepID=A0AA88AL36_FICCA|nr:hypothetical protein TIFTF001_021844 [Ficus carica]